MGEVLAKQPAVLGADGTGSGPGTEGEACGLARGIRG